MHFIGRCLRLIRAMPRLGTSWRRIFINKANIGLLPNSEGYARAREAEEKALAIDPNYAPAHSGLGRIAMANNDFVNAAKHFERALALDPNDLNVLGNSAAFLQSLGRLQEGLALQEAVVRRDPVNVTALYNLGNDQLLMGQFDAAIASYRSVLSLSPGYGLAHYQICEAMLLKGDAPAALAEIEQEKSEVWRLIGLPMAYHALGRKTESDAALATLIAKFEKDGPYNIAYVYAFRGDADKAFEWLDKAVAISRSGTLPYRSGEPVRQDPFRPALAALPAQNRPGPRATRQDPVQGDAAAAMSTHPEERKLAAIMFTDMVVLKLLPSWGPASRRSAL